MQENDGSESNRNWPRICGGYLPVNAITGFTTINFGDLFFKFYTIIPFMYVTTVGCPGSVVVTITEPTML
jgi:hypothetical protein